MATAHQIRDLIAQTTTRTVRPRVPREVRDEVCRYASRRRREGVAWAVIARETGLEVRKLQRWSGRARLAAPAPVLRPVEVVREPEPAQGLALIALSGVRVGPRRPGGRPAPPAARVIGLSRRVRVLVLLWDGTGLCLYQKRIERGRFASLWRRDEQETFEMTLSELALFLEGSTLAGALPLSPPPTSPQALTPFLREAEPC